ncbi:hypothetical protein EV424DRAFT_1534629 [Suillus variegatus]|nr:hypothetical protein EV424DRAFT_1534629 [Suillus variegatus]
MAGQKDPDSVPNMDATLSQSQKIDIAALLNKVSENQRAAAAMNNEQKESERMKADADCVGGEVIQAQAARSTTHQSRKRKMDQVDSNNDSNKENISPTHPTPAACHIPYIHASLPDFGPLDPVRSDASDPISDKLPISFPVHLMLNTAYSVFPLPGVSVIVITGMITDPLTYASFPTRV